jgi:hypothetical protein
MPSTSQNRCLSFNDFLKYILFFASVVIILITILPWDELSSCFQKEIIVFIYCFTYWAFFKHSNGKIMIDIFQMGIIFGMTIKVNTIETEENSECTDISSSLPLEILHKTFLVFYYTLLGLMAILLFTSILLVGYVIVEEYYFQPKKGKMDV